MAFCSSCGSAVEGKFCPKCGAPLAQGAAPPSDSTPAPPPPSQQSSELTPNVAGALCYIPVLIPAIVFLALAPYNQNKEIRFHALQALFIQLLWLAAALLVSIVLPVAGWLTLGPLLHLAVIVLSLFMMWKTYEKQKVVLPVIGPEAEKRA
jgi:uncharacterized membrane protein